MDKTELTIATYNQSAGNYVRKFSNFDLYNESFDLFLAYLSPKQKVIDIACGPGIVARYLLNKIPSIQIIGIDLSEEMLKLAKEYVPSGEFLIGDIRKMDFESDSFDAAVASFCLPYLDYDEAAEFFKMLARLIKPQSYTYLSTMQGFGHQITPASFTEGNPLFLNYYPVDFLEDQFVKNGFAIVEHAELNYPESDGSFTVDLIYILQKK